MLYSLWSIHPLWPTSSVSALTNITSTVLISTPVVTAMCNYIYVSLCFFFNIYINIVCICFCYWNSTIKGYFWSSSHPLPVMRRSQELGWRQRQSGFLGGGGFEPQLLGVTIQWHHPGNSKSWQFTVGHFDPLFDIVQKRCIELHALIISTCLDNIWLNTVQSFDISFNINEK